MKTASGRALIFACKFNINRGQLLFVSRLDTKVSSGGNARLLSFGSALRLLLSNSTQHMRSMQT